MMAEAKSMPARQQFADLHRYTLQGKLSLVDQQTKQITLFGPLLPVDREYVSENSIAIERQTGEPRASSSANEAALSECAARSVGRPNARGGSQGLQGDRRGRAALVNGRG